MTTPVLIVISDLHLGGGDMLDDCDAEIEARLVSFIREISKKYSAVELIINGDFLDFPQSPPWKKQGLESIGINNAPLCFTQDQSLEKFENIYRAHEPVFKTLGQLLAAADENRLVVIPGNHDADLFWPGVRESFSAKVCSGEGERSRLRFHLEQVYRPASFPAAWIEHGHQHDPLNSFTVGGDAYWSSAAPPIFADLSGTLRLFECIGTRFLIKYMNSLDASYPFVDNIKPFKRFLTIFGASVFTWRFGPLKAAIATWAMMKYLLVTFCTHRDDLLSVDSDRDDAPSRKSSDLLSKFLEEMNEDEQRDFLRRLRERGVEINRSLALYVSDEKQADALLTFLAENLDLLDGLGEMDDDDDSYLSLDQAGNNEDYLALREGFDFDETEALISAAKKILDENQAELVIMGHTHERVNPDQSLNYINIGSWTRYYIFGDDEKVEPLRLLKTRSYEAFPYQLNYVEIVPCRLAPSRLITYAERTS